MAAAASPQPPPSTRCTSRSRPPLSRGQALAASSAHSCECSSGRSSDHVCECRNPQPDRTPPDEQPSQQRHLATQSARIAGPPPTTGNPAEIRRANYQDLVSLPSRWREAGNDLVDNLAADVVFSL